MRKRTLWNDEYRGIVFEIQNFSFSKEDKEDRWTFYLYLYAESFPQEIQEKVKPKAYFTKYGSYMQIAHHDNPLNNLEWHCGITYLHCEGTEPFTQLKAGCDYQHLWDEGKNYSAEELETDVKQCIDSIYEMFPAFKPGKELWEEFIKKFPKEEKTFGKRYDRNAKLIEDQNEKAQS